MKLTKSLDIKRINNRTFTFSTGKEVYWVIFTPGKNNDYSMTLRADLHELSEVLNEGDFYKILATTCTIVLEFLSKQQPDSLRFVSSDEKKYNVFKRYITGLIPDEYAVSDLSKSQIVIKRK